MKRPPRTSPLTAFERALTRHALARHDELARARRADATDERISRSEGEYERLRMRRAAATGCTTTPQT